jgi:hypothetical protein
MACINKGQASRKNFGVHREIAKKKQYTMQVKRLDRP